MLAAETWLWLALAAVVPAMFVLTVENLSAVLDGCGRLRHRLRPHRYPAADRRAIETLAADLCRIAAQLREIEYSDELHRADRMRAAVLAYDDVLLSACRALEIDVAARAPLASLERLETEAALACEGLVW